MVFLSEKLHSYVYSYNLYVYGKDETVAICDQICQKGSYMRKYKYL